MEKKASPPCAVLFLCVGLTVVVLFVCRTLLPSQNAGGASFSLQDLKVLGVILGGCALAFAAFLVYGVVSGWLQSRIVRQGNEYLARTLLIELEKSTGFPIPADLPEAPGQESIHPVYLRIFKSNHGLCLAALTGGSNRGWVPQDNAGRFRQLSGDFTGRIVLPRGTFYLYYILCRQEGNLTVELAPPNEAGYSGALPDPLGEDQVKMVIVFNTIRSARHPTGRGRIITREQPLKLKLVVVDKKGQDDPAATCEFYNALYKSIQPGKSEEVDESWLYGPRPWWHY